MAEMLKLDEQFVILSEEARPTAQRVLKQGDTFAVFDPHGDINPGPASSYGLFHAGTRFLSELRAAARQPSAAAPQLDDRRGQHDLLRRPDQSRHPAARARGARTRRPAPLSLARAVERRRRRAHPRVQPRAALDRDAALDPVRCRLRRRLRSARHETRAPRRSSARHPRATAGRSCAIAGWTASSGERGSARCARQTGRTRTAGSFSFRSNSTNGSTSKSTSSARSAPRRGRVIDVRGACRTNGDRRPPDALSDRQLESRIRPVGAALVCRSADDGRPTRRTASTRTPAFRGSAAVRP